MTENEEPQEPLPEEETTEAPRAEPGPGVPWRLAVFLVLAVVVVVFAVQNTQDVELRFLGWTWQLPLVIILLVAIVVSVLLDEILGGIFRRRRLQRRREKEELRRLRGEA